MAAAGASVFSFALGLSGVALPLLALSEGYSSTEVGLLTGFSALSQMTSRFGLGRLMRVVSDWVLVAVAAALLSFSCVVVAVSALWVPFLVAQLLQGVSRACYWTGSQTHVVRGEGSSVRSLATVNLVGNVGLLLGPLAAGVLAGSSISGALWCGAGSAALAVVPACFLDRLPPFVPLATRPPGMIWRRPGVSAGCFAGVTAGAWRGLLSSYVPVALVEAKNTSTSVGALVAIANAASLIGSFAVSRLSTRGFARYFAAGTIATGVSVAAVGLVAHSVVLAAVVLLVSGLGAGGIQTLGPAIASDAVHPQEKGEAIAATGTFRAAALFAAPIGVAGMVTVLPLAACLAVVGALIALPSLTTPGLRRQLTSAEQAEQPG
jgi:MFS family permease